MFRGGGELADATAGARSTARPEACRIAGLREYLRADRCLCRWNRRAPRLCEGCTDGAPDGTVSTSRRAKDGVNGDAEARVAMIKEPSMRGTGNRLWLAAGLAAVLVSVSPGIASAASTITGTVTFDGKVPALRPLAMDAEPVCKKMHAGKPVANEMLALGSGNTMGNIMVAVSKG